MVFVQAYIDIVDSGHIYLSTFIGELAQRYSDLLPLRSAYYDESLCLNLDLLAGDIFNANLEGLASDPPWNYGIVPFRFRVV